MWTQGGWTREKKLLNILLYMVKCTTILLFIEYYNQFVLINYTQFSTFWIQIFVTMKNILFLSLCLSGILLMSPSIVYYVIISIYNFLFDILWPEMLWITSMVSLKEGRVIEKLEIKKKNIINMEYIHKLLK